MARLHPNEDPQIRDAFGEEIIRLPDGQVGYIRCEAVDNEDYFKRPTEVAVIGVDGQRLARFPIKKELHGRGIILFRQSVLVRHDRLMLTFYAVDLEAV